MLTQPSRSRDPGIRGAWPRSGPPESRCQPGLPQSGPCWPASAGREGPAKAPGVYKALPWARNCLTFWPRASAGSGPGSSRCGARPGGRTKHPCRGRPGVERAPMQPGRDGEQATLGLVGGDKHLDPDLRDGSVGGGRARVHHSPAAQPGLDRLGRAQSCRALWAH